MSRSKARLAADWFAKLRLNAQNEVEHTDLVAVEAEVTTVASDVASLDYYSPSNPPPSSAPTADDVLAATATTAVGAVGSYAFMLWEASWLTSTGAGATTAGSNLRYGTISGNRNGWSSAMAMRSGAASGTWRMMGAYNSQGGSNTGGGLSLWIRIA